MSEFIFIIPRTPKAYKTKIRESLWEITQQSLINQTYISWQALVVCDDFDEKPADERFIYIISEALKKGEKINDAINYIISNKIDVDFVIRLDDDDVMMPDSLKKSLNYDFDVYADKYHTFYDLSSGLSSIVKRKWLANTVIHKVSHAFKISDDTGLHIINHDHSLKWHRYYKDKKIVYSKMNQPIYIRILSPVSLSAIEADNYETYLSFFGKWKFSMPDQFKKYSTQLKIIQNENNLFIKIRNYSYFSNIKSKLHKIFSSI
jgi:hypothetical protein